MGNKTFKDLTQIECVEAYKKMETNSDRLWRSAELLASHDDFGGAIRDHITSIEELIKAMIIFLDSTGFEFRKVDGMTKILNRNHTIRHFIAYLMFILNVFTEDIKLFYMNVNKDPTLFKGWSNKGKMNRKIKSKMQKYLAIYTFKKVLKFKTEFKWFEKVELLRQSGTHVDYDDKLISPEDISQSDYKQVSMRLHNVRFIGKEFFKTFDGQNKYLEEEIEKFKKDFNDKGWYNKMGETLKGIKNKNPFEAFTKLIEEMEIGSTKEIKERLRDESLLE